MGLLNRAESSHKDIQQKQWDDFLVKIENLEKGIDFSVVLFRNIVDFFEIDKAALFVRSDNERGYNCLISRGYDKTTGNRLRIDENAMDSNDFQSSVINHEPRLSVDAPPFLKLYMSSREYGLLEKIHWLPFVNDQVINSVIMISQWNNIVPDNWMKMFQIISSSFSESIYNSRKALVHNVEDTDSRGKYQELNDLLVCKDIKEMFIIRIDLQPLITLLSSIKDGLNPLGLRKEVLSVFRTMAGPQQDILELGNHQLLLLLDKARVPDKELFLHQLSASLPLLFQDLNSPPELIIQDYNQPADEKEKEELLNTLLPHDT